ncbi:hypothetical protein IH992_14540 [Candidatus Poribacteria bacterium]|nr:hypothetical protein [Candidatus Poribacteria bacterium]
MMITEQEIQQFDHLGAVTIDTPLTASQISSAVNAMNQLLPFQPGTAEQLKL